ncbi:flagellar hook-basal body complex protein FliE [Roseomonas aerophila]|uniref:Flagellar hook-basal body complex protein FliE n=1 Tax=Teichococcus aerophilus TaxID=1224513 RepID=A0ABR7RMW4_9PROT|nr:flagellar hook-basal body complex protein FliE [Pseudoroseomonas aerophila]MBC9207728.1 flagellar hook-basal body complex protein FliE [Pseudoroseomonas aerophila]
MSSPIPAIAPVSAALRAYGASSAANTGDFGAMVGDAARSSLATLRRAELVSARGVAGTADVQEVVQAATAAELTVQTMTQLRDKVVGAYTDVLRMAV